MTGPHSTPPSSSAPAGAVRVTTLALCGLASIAAFTVLAWLSHGPLSIRALLATLAVAWSSVAWAWRSAGRLAPAQILPVLWSIAIALRIVGFLGSPVLEDDWYRYVWDGRQFATAGHPYDVPPSAHFTDESLPDEFQTVLSNINQPDVPTIYGPICQFVFLGGYAIAPARLWPLKVLFIAADLAALVFLLKLAGPRHALLYAWCPLAIQETAFTAHPEILGVVFIVAALWARGRQRPILVAILCGCAVAARIHALLLVPFLLWPLRARPVMVFVATVAACYAPFWFQGTAGDLAGLKAFLGEWEFNSSLFALVKSAAGWTAAKNLCLVAFLAIYALLFVRFARQSNAGASRAIPDQVAVFGQWMLAAFFLLSAVVNPWYLLWLVPFVAMRPSWVGCVSLAAVSLSYIHGGVLEAAGLASYEHPKWLRPLEYGLVLAAAVGAVWNKRQQLLSAENKTH